jgi:arginyl-tRNA synthetase
MTLPAIRPLPASVGIGFFSPTRIPEYEDKGYRIEQTERFCNYFFTRDNFRWPQDPAKQWSADNPGPIVIDGFSPNLNKDLHVGHLRNLALGNAIVKMTKGNPVALLGATLGIKSGAEQKYDTLCQRLGYNVKKYYDVLLPTDVVPWRPDMSHLPKDMSEVDATKLVASGDLKVPCFWDGPNGKVIVITSDGRRLYSYHDLAFKELAKPNFYITGAEQSARFKELGLGDKHLPMGLILGEDGTKMKSREGTSFLLEDAIQATIGALGKEPGERRVKPSWELAWNVLCWQMLSVSRTQNVKWNVDDWCRPESPGMYMTYTNARVYSALKAATDDNPLTDINGLEVAARDFIEGVRKEMTDADLALVGLCEYARFYHGEALKKMDPAVLVHYLHDLARALGRVYCTEKMVGGRLPFLICVARALWFLRAGMKGIGMFILNDV